MDALKQAAEQLAAELAAVDDGLLLVITGAGVSLASGIPTFRGNDPGAVWKRDLTELATRAYFEADPVASWRWYLARFDTLLDKKPNPTHHALVELERWQEGRGGRFLLVTQNIDVLHDAAGSRQLVHVHGRADRVRCSADGCRHGAPRGSLPLPADALEAFRRAPSRDALPRCPACGSVLRPHVLWFDEFYNEHHDYRWDEVQQAAMSLRLALFVGTSFAVGVTELLLRAGLQAGVPVLAIDPGTDRPPHPGVRLLRHPAEELLPAVCERLAQQASSSRR
ncbi:MAG: hypothetical protein D6696_01440 [Acidobacteria bacterium]|nr:MAG: hypothetical protein D6696_01440 [Acidobacteriota bacterium]